MYGDRRTGMVMAALAGVASGCWPYGAAGQTPGGVGDAAKDPTLMASIQQIMHVGGGTMYVIAGMSFLTVAFIAYFFLVIRERDVAPRALHLAITERISEGALDDAWLVCVNRPCPLSAVVLAAIAYVKAAPEFNVAMLKDVMEGEGARQSELIQGQTQYLLDIAVISPMIGLFGTVVGMLQAFSAVSLDAVGAKPLLLVAGVSKALYATAFGLVVGIPAMAFYGYFRRKAAQVVSSLEVACIHVMTALSATAGK